MKSSIISCALLFFVAIALPMIVTAEDWIAPSSGIYSSDDGSSVIFRFYNPNSDSDPVTMLGTGILTITGKEGGFDSKSLNFTVRPGEDFKKEYKLPNWATRVSMKVDYSVGSESYQIMYETTVSPPSKSVPATPGFGILGGLIVLIIISRKRSN